MMKKEKILNKNETLADLHLENYQTFKATNNLQDENEHLFKNLDLPNDNSTRNNELFSNLKSNSENNKILKLIYRSLDNFCPDKRFFPVEKISKGLMGEGAFCSERFKQGIHFGIKITYPAHLHIFIPWLSEHNLF